MKYHKTIIGTTISIVFFTTVAHAGAPSVTRDGFMQMLESVSPCDDTEYLSCIGISQERCRSAGSKCVDDMSAQIDLGKFEHYMAQFSDCFLRIIAVRHERLKHCDAEEDEDTMDSTAELENYDFNTTANALFDEVQPLSSLFSTDKVTLPVFEPHEIMSHGLMEDSGLWVLMLSTEQSVQEVIQFYQQEIPGFHRFDLEQNSVLFMEAAPANFQLPEHFELYTNTPHVYAFPNTHPTTREEIITIEIAYRPIAVDFR